MSNKPSVDRSNSDYEESITTEEDDTIVIDDHPPISADGVNIKRAFDTWKNLWTMEEIVMYG